MPELDDILPSLTPPPGGLHALRERLDHRRRRAVWWVGVVPLGAAANLVLVQEPEIEQAARELLAGGRRPVNATPDQPSAGGAP